MPVDPKIRSEIYTQINFKNIVENKNCFFSGYCEINDAALNYKIFVDESGLRASLLHFGTVFSEKINNFIRSSDTAKLFQKL